MTTWYLDKENSSAHEIVKTKHSGTTLACVVANIQFSDESNTLQCLKRVDITQDSIVSIEEICSADDIFALSIAERLNGKKLINKADLAGVIIRAQNFLSTDEDESINGTVEAKMFRDYMVKMNQLIGHGASKEALICGAVVRAIHRQLCDKIETKSSSNDPDCSKAISS